LPVGQVSCLPTRPAGALSPVFPDRAPAQTAGARGSDRRIVFRRSIGMTGALLLWRFQRINEKESVMHLSSLIHRSSRYELPGRTGRQIVANSIHSKIRTSIRFEDAVATISLAALSTTVLALIYQSMML
jgi:hypothetical protein